MAQTRIGHEKATAARIGISVHELRSFRQRGMKWCYLCREWKPVDRFSVDNARTDGRKSACRPCASLKSVASRFGVKPQEIQAMKAAKQVCEICGGSESLVIDHEHATGFIRGILCTGCNVAIGLFGEDVSLIKSAIQYLEHRNGQDKHRMV